MPIARRAIVHGLVQGVWFRESTRREAERLGAGGWVRNLDDGTLEAWFEGDPAIVDGLVAWVHHGPPAARVERVEVREERPAGEAGFRVR